MAVMSQSSSSRVITAIDIGLNADEHYVQFVPPATFGVIYNRVAAKVYLVRADGERSPLRGTADKIYVLRGFIGLRRREERKLELRWDIEDNIIRNVLCSFGSHEKLRAAVSKHCPFSENAEIINNMWASKVFSQDVKGTVSLE
jgi:hypothetical protein